MKVCLVGSSGGHLTHLYMLKPFWKDKERFWVTFDKEDARSLLEGEKVYPCYYPTNRSLKALVKNTKIAWDVLHKEKPDLIVSCGAAVAVPFFYIGKMMGAKVVYIEVFDRIDKPTMTGKMIRYSIVLIPNTFMWWIMNSSDRVMVTYMIGAAANGIYAVSYKLPTLVSTLTGIFNQAWSYSAIREEGTSDETEYNNKMFKTLSAIAFMMGIGLLLLTKPFLGVYVADSYYDAWKYTPFLIIGCVYLTLGTFMATSYTVHKDSFGYLFSGSFGAAFNILLNFILIPVIGVYGAALATCISYIAVFMFRVFHTRKYIKYDIMYKEFILGSLLMLVSAILMFVDGMKGFLLQLVILLIGFTVFSKTWIPMLQFFLNKIQRKRVS